MEVDLLSRLERSEDTLKVWRELRDHLASLVWYLQALNGTAVDNWGPDKCRECDRPGMTLVRAARQLSAMESER
jgi:hypothetical protein